MHKLQELNIFINVQLKNLGYVCIKLMIHVYNSWLSKMVVVKQCNVSLAVGSGYRKLMAAGFPKFYSFDPLLSTSNAR